MLNDTQIPAPRVPLVEKDSVFASRPWFRFWSNLCEFVGLKNGVVPETSGGTGNVTYAAGDILYASAADTLTRLPAPGALNPSYLGTDGTNMPQWIQVSYGAFGDTTTQSTTANTPKAISINTTVYHRGIDQGTPSSRIVVTYAGLYAVNFSLQLSNPSTTAEDDVAVWVRINGADLAYTSSWITIAKQHGGVNGTGVLAVNIQYLFAANDYIELYWLSKTGTSQIQTIASSASPQYPASPGVILTMNQII